MNLGFRPFRIALLAIAVAAGPLIANAVPHFPGADAKNHVGENVGISGVVTEVHESSQGNLMLNFGAAYPHQDFTAVIFAADRAKFAQAAGLQGKTITVWGKVTMYRSHPEIVLKDASQLKVGPP